MKGDVIKIERTRKGYPAIGVGGGAYTNTFECRFVIDGKTGTLKKALFVKTRGPRACRLDQAIVPLEIGDVICEMSGRLPVVAENPDISLRVQKVLSLMKGEAEARVVDISNNFPFEFPLSVIEGASLYHNRDGSYFCTTERG